MKKLLLIFLPLLGVLLLTMIFVIAGFAASSVYLDTESIYHMPSTQIEFDRGCFNVVYFKNDTIQDKTLIFSTTHMQVDVDVNNQSIYSCGYEENTPAFIKSTGTVYHVVRLPADYAGAAIRIKTVPYYEENLPNPHLYIYGGSYSACMMQLYFRTLPIVISAFILLFCAIVLSIMYLKYLRKLPGLNKSGFLALILLALYLGVWLMNVKGGLQFFISSPYIIYFISAFSFLILPVPFNVFLYSLCQGRFKKGFLLFAWIFTGTILLNWVWQLFTPLDMFYLKPFTYLLMLLNFIYALTACIHETAKHKNRAAKSCLLPLLLLGFSAAFYVLLLFLDGETTIFPYLITYILVISYVIFVRIFVHRYSTAQAEAKQARYYRELALADLLCGVRSRDAYTELLSCLEKDGKKPQYQAVITFGVEHLKEIRKTYGPENADLALCACCHGIRTIFPLEGICYRTAEDEFIYIISDLVGISGMIQKFQAFIPTINLPFPLHIAYGYAFFDEDQDSSFKNTIRRSNEDMHQNKKNASEEPRLSREIPNMTE